MLATRLQQVNVCRSSVGRASDDRTACTHLFALPPLQGQHTVVATSTASGKSLCYNVPVLQALAQVSLQKG